MGRKIPAKKHRGVKDPLIQQARRLETLKSKINAPPKDPDEQPVPRSLTRLFAFQKKRDENDAVKKKQKVKRLNHTEGWKNGSGLKQNPVSRLRRLPGESGRDFSLRINSAVRALHNPVEDLNYPQDIEADDVKGERMAAQRERRARKKKQGKKADLNKEPQLTRTQKLALKRKEKKFKIIQANEEKQEVVYERVAFGEVSGAPPALRFPHRRVRGDAGGGAPRPGRRGLLLAGLLGAGVAGDAGGAGDAARRERARLEAVSAYRALKASKMKEKNK